MAEAQVRVLQTRGPDLLSVMVQELQKTVQAMGPNYPRPILLLTPASFTYSASRALSQGFGQGFLGIQVLSPEDLCREVVELAGSGGVDILNEVGRGMLMSQILGRLSRDHQLEYYASSSGQQGFVLRLLEQLDEFRVSGLSAEILESLLRTQPFLPSTASKYTDLIAAWKAYEETLSGKFEDSVARWSEMLKRLPLSRLMQDAELYIFGFDYLRSDIIRLILTAYPLARQITIGLVCDADASDAHIFLAAIHSIEYMQEALLAINGACTVRHVEDPHIRRMRNPSLNYLEHAVFANHAQAAPALHAIQTFQATDSYQECLYAAQTLMRWHRDGIQWNEMAVALCETETLPSLLPMVLRQANIPFSSRKGEPMLVSDFTVYVLSVVRAVCLGYMQSDMLKMIRSGFAPLTKSDGYDLENYVLEHGMDRKKWLKPLKVPARESEKAFVLSMESARLRIIEPLENLHRTLAARDCTGALAAAALYRFLIHTGVYEKLLQCEQDLLNHGQVLAAEINRQSWKRMNETLDQIAMFASNKRIPLRDLALMMGNAITSQEIKSIPLTADAVDVSQPDMFMVSGLRAVIVMGLQDKTLDMQDSLISEKERLGLQEMAGMHIGLTRQERMSRELQRMYQALSLPQEQLLLTCARHKPDGSLLYPSQVFQSVKHLLGEDAGSSAVMPVHPMQTVETLATRMRDFMDGKQEALAPAASDSTGMVWREALGFMYRCQDYKAAMQSITRSLHVSVDSPFLGRELAHALYLPGRISISRLETFAECPHKHFFAAGLRPVQRRDYSFEADQQGTFYHEVLSAYMKLASQEPDWPDLTDARINQLLDRVMPAITEAFKDGPLDLNEAGHYRTAEMVRNVRRTAWSITRSMSGEQRFLPVGTEIPFGPKHSQHHPEVLPPVVLTLSSGETVALSGQIDRLDRFSGPDQQDYMRILDYKSSSHEVKKKEVQAGLSLQIPLYLSALQQGHPEATPAGALYQIVKDPIVREDDRDPAAVSSATLKENQLTGIFLDDPAVIAAMGPLKIPRKLATGGSVIAAASKDELQELIESAKDTATSLAERIMQGETAIAPLQSGQTSPCDYCDFRSACRFDPRIPGCHMKVM